MKTCPQCGKTYPDEYAFCLSDGAPLNLPPPNFSDEQPTVVRPTAPRKRPATSTILLFILAGLLTLALGAAAGVLYVFWPRQASNETAKTNTSTSPTPSPANRTASEPKETPENNTRPQPTPSPTPSPDDRPPTSQPPEPPDTDYGPDPGTTRISFRRGRAEETVTGSVNNFRSFVLYAKNGQDLTARIRSDRRCVTFDGGNSRISYPTDEGDNELSIVNNCDTPANFTLSVSIR